MSLSLGKQIQVPNNSRADKTCNKFLDWVSLPVYTPIPRGHATCHLELASSTRF